MNTEEIKHEHIGLEDEFRRKQLMDRIAAAFDREFQKKSECRCTCGQGGCWQTEITPDD